MIYFAVAMLLAVALVVLHWREGRSDKRRVVRHVVIAVVTLVVGIASVVRWQPTGLE